MKQRCLMLGSGTNGATGGRRLRSPWSVPEEETEWITLDIDPDKHPDIVFDLNKIHWDGESLPFPDSHFDEIHAYEVLEHIGAQGNYKGFFNEFREYWRLLKPECLLIGSCPARQSIWAWGDPGHTRIVTADQFVYLHRSTYEMLEGTMSSDYSKLVDPCWWETVHAEVKNDTAFIFALKKVS